MVTVFLGTSGNDVANASTSTLTGFTGGTIADLLDADWDSFIGYSGADTIYASNVDFNHISGGGGADNLHGGNQGDRFGFSNGDVEAGEVIDGGAGTDSINAESAAGALVNDFRNAEIISIEKVGTYGFSPIDEARTFIFGARQVGGGQLTSNLALDGGLFSVIAEFKMNAQSVIDLSAFTFTNWSAGDVIRITGDASSETMTGTSQRDEFSAGLGVDTLIGLGGDDKLDGGLGGGDTLRGGLGNDTYIVDSILDVTDETTGGGIGDYVFSTASYTAAAGIERLYLDGAANIDATGRAGQNDILVGNAGANSINGLSGNDVMRGGLGNDTYFVDAALDTTDEVTGGGGAGDYVYSMVSFTEAAGVERLYLTGAAAINGTGRDGQNDIITGNSAANILDGKTGNDVLTGGLGNDALTGGAGLDTFRFDTALNAATNMDAITGFLAVDDLIQLENAVMAGLGLATGALAAGMFNTGAAAAQTDDRIIYNAATGALLYDLDGLNGAAGVQFALLVGAPAISAADFAVI
jgi:Ca2+-binding RTX toxin-like protein